MKPRPSSIANRATHAKDPNSDYVIRPRTVEELLIPLAEMNLPLTVEDLKHPNPELAFTLYHAIIEILAPWRIPYMENATRDIVPKGMREPEGRQDVIIVYCEMRDFLAKIRFSDFNLEDLTCPQGPRLLKNLNVVVNYAMFSDSTWTVYEPVALETEKISVQAEERTKAEASLKKSITLTESNIKQGVEGAEKVDEENKELEAGLRQTETENEKLLNEVFRFKQERQVLKNNLSTLHSNLIANKRKAQRYQQLAATGLESFTEPNRELNDLIQEIMQEFDKVTVSVNELDDEFNTIKKNVNSLEKSTLVILENIQRLEKDANRHHKTNNAIALEITSADDNLKKTQKQKNMVNYRLQTVLADFEKLEDQQARKEESVSLYYKNFDKRNAEAKAKIMEYRQELSEIGKEDELLNKQIRDMRDSREKIIRELDDASQKLQKCVDVLLERLQKLDVEC